MQQKRIYRTEKKYGTERDIWDRKGWYAVRVYIVRQR